MNVEAVELAAVVRIRCRDCDKVSESAQSMHRKLEGLLVITTLRLGAPIHRGDRMCTCGTGILLRLFTSSSLAEYVQTCDVRCVERLVQHSLFNAGAPQIIRYCAQVWCDCVGHSVARLHYLPFSLSPTASLSSGWRVHPRLRRMSEEAMAWSTCSLAKSCGTSSTAPCEIGHQLSTLAQQLRQMVLLIGRLGFLQA